MTRESCSRTGRVIAGGVTTPRGFRAAGIGAGIKRPRPDGATPLDLALIVSDTPGDGCGRLHRQQGPGGAGHRLARAPHPLRAAWRAPSSSTAGCANACTGDEGMAQRPGDGGRDGAPGRAATPTRCSSPRQASSASACRCDKITSALPRAFAALGDDQGPAAARAIMTTDPFPKEAAASRRDRRTRGRHRRHGQGLGNDRADDGDDAGLRHDGRRRAAAAAAARAARRRQHDVQRHHGGRRVLDQRHA